MSDRDFVPNLLYYPMTEPEWVACHDALAPHREGDRAALAGALDAIQARAKTVFAMVAWNIDDICGAVARYRDVDVDYGDECTPEAAGLTPRDVDSLMEHASGSLEEGMIRRGWDILEDLAGAFCEKELWWSEQ